MAIQFGVSSMVAPLRAVLVQGPTTAFGAAFDDPGCGFLHPVNLEVARKEHELFCHLLASLGVTVHQLDAESPHAEQIYTYDPALVTGRGAILLRSGKPSRLGEEEILGRWFIDNGVPILGRITDPGTVDGGDVLWLRPDLIGIGRSLRTNQRGIDQLVELLASRVEVFDVPYDRGPQACLHLMSTISLVAEDLALVDRRRLPAGLYTLLRDLDIRLIDVPDDELDTLATNVLTVRPGIVVTVSGNPVTRRRLESVGVEVHAFAGEEIAINGTGGPTCLTRPIHRE